MPKHYKEMMDELINKIDEDAPANAVGDGGNVALPPKHEPGVKNKRKEIDPLMYAKPLKRKIKESDDNNNVVLRGVIEKIENIEQALDEKVNGKTEFKIEDKEEYFVIKAIKTQDKQKMSPSFKDKAKIIPR